MIRDQIRWLDADSHDLAKFKVVGYYEYMHRISGLILTSYLQLRKMKWYGLAHTELELTDDERALLKESFTRLNDARANKEYNDNLNKASAVMKESFRMPDADCKLINQKVEEP